MNFIRSVIRPTVYDSLTRISSRYQTFGTKYNVAKETVIDSRKAYPRGIPADAVITITGGEYSLDDTAWTSDPGVWGTSRSIMCRITSSDGYDTQTTGTITIDQSGGFPYAFPIMFSELVMEFFAITGLHESGVPGDPVGLWLDPDMTDIIGLSFAEFYAQLPAEHQILYSADGITPYDDATILVNIAAYPNLNLDELMGNATKGYAQYVDGTSRYILNKGLRWFGEPEVAPTIYDRYLNTSHYTGLENYA